MRKILLFVGLVAGLSVFGDSFDSNLDDLTSVSMAYGARDTRVHPAALGFDSQLNGSQLQTILNTAINPNRTDDYGLGISYGPAGFHWERQGGVRNRYQFAFGVPLLPHLFFGHRFSLNRYADPAFSYDSWDSGFQYRPVRELSFGLMANNWNQPPSNGAKLPVEFVFGTTLRLSELFDITVDARTYSEEFMKEVDGQLATRWYLADGVQFQIGYHNVRQWQLGLQLDFDYGSVIATAVPRPKTRSFMIGMTSTPLQQKTILSPATVLHVRLDSTLVEEGNPGGFFRSEHPSLLSVIEKLRKAPSARNIRSVFLEIDSFPLGLAAAQELHATLLDLRNQGFVVEAHLGQAGLKEYLIASACAKIHMEPEGELRFLGLKAERYFFKGTLDKVGVEGQFLAKGKYKSAPEMFTRTESSPTSRQTTWDELERAEAHVLALLSASRQISTQKWKQMLQTALYSSQQAMEEKIVDNVLSFRSTKQKLDDHMRLSENVERRSLELALPDRVAVVIAEGSILQSRTPVMALGGQSQITPERFQRKLSRALRDPRTKAIVVRVSSPGGEVMASQELAELVKNARLEKPVIISMGDVAASGGYYMSAPADAIFASPLTLTGSIGVFLGKFHFAGLYRWLKVNKEIITKAPYPGLFSEDRAWSSAEMQVLTQRLNTYYDSFVSFVARSRGMTREKAEDAAQGRVWLGDQAKQHQLADELGGYIPALRYAAKAGEAAPNVEWWEVQSSPGLFDWSEEFSGSKTSEAVSQLLGKTAAKDLIWASSLEKNPYLYLSPVEKLE